MAILFGVPGLAASIQSNGQTLYEYPNEEDEDWVSRYGKAVPVGCQTTCYVECQSDAEFIVDLGINRPVGIFENCNAFTIDVDVDGLPISRLNCLKSDLAAGTWSGSISSMVTRISPTEKRARNLRFSTIEKVDHSTAAEVEADAKRANKLGEIVVFVYPTYITDVPRSDTTSYQEPAAGISSISEKALKGRSISHGVSFGDSRYFPVIRDLKYQYPQDRSSPIGAFRFLYRCKAALQAELIIPRSESPESVAASPGAQSRGGAVARISREKRLAELQKEMDTLKAEEAGNRDIKPKIKAERQESSFQGQKRTGDVEIIGERSAKASRKSDPSKIIDLTDD